MVSNEGSYYLIGLGEGVHSGGEVTLGRVLLMTLFTLSGVLQVVHDSMVRVINVIRAKEGGMLAFSFCLKTWCLNF